MRAGVPECSGSYTYAYARDDAIGEASVSADRRPVADCWPDLLLPRNVPRETMRLRALAVTLLLVGGGTAEAGKGLRVDADGLLPNHVYAAGAFSGVGLGTTHTRVSGGSGGADYCVWNAGGGYNVNTPAFTTNAAGSYHATIIAESGLTAIGNSQKTDPVTFEQAGVTVTYSGVESCQNFPWGTESWTLTGPRPPEYRYTLIVSNGCGTFSPDVPGDKVYQLVIAGVTVLTQTVRGSRNVRIPTQNTLYYDHFPATEGAVWSWLEDGAVIFTGIEQNTGGDSGGTTNTRSVCTAGAPSPSPTLTPRPTPTATVAPSPYPTKTPGPTAPPTTPFPTPPPAATPVVMSNMEDFYSAVLRALNDAGNGKSADFTDTTPYTNNADPTPPNLEKAAVDGTAAMDDIKKKFSQAGVNAKATFDTLPKSLGTACEIVLPTAWAIGSDSVINLCDWSAEIALLRLLVLWLVTLSMAFLYLGALTYSYD